MSMFRFWEIFVGVRSAQILSDRISTGEIMAIAPPPTAKTHRFKLSPIICMLNIETNPNKSNGRWRRKRIQKNDLEQND